MYSDRNKWHMSTLSIPSQACTWRFSVFPGGLVGPLSSHKTTQLHSSFLRLISILSSSAYSSTGQSCPCKLTRSALFPLGSPFSFLWLVGPSYGHSSSQPKSSLLLLEVGTSPRLYLYIYRSSLIYIKLAKWEEVGKAIYETTQTYLSVSTPDPQNNNGSSCPIKLKQLFFSIFRLWKG